MTTKHEIEIEGLPEGWRAVAFRKVVPGEFYFSDISNQICKACAFDGYGLIVEKIKPRRIVLEETGEGNTITNGIFDLQHIGGLRIWHEPKIWRELKEGE